MGAREVQVFHDHVLVKEPGTPKPTPWHQDMPYYCVDGMQTASFWIPLDPVTEENTLRLVLGSHLWPKLLRPKKWAGGEDFYANDAEFMDLPEVENGSFAILERALEPGDAIVFNYRTIHGARGNTGSRRRRAFSARFVGDDARFIQRPGRTSPPYPGIGQSSGERLAGGLVSDGLAGGVSYSPLRSLSGCSRQALSLCRHGRRRPTIHEFARLDPVSPGCRSPSDLIENEQVGATASNLTRRARS